MTIAPQHRHLPVVIRSRRVRDGFRLRFRVRCWRCDLDRGFRHKQNAKAWWVLIDTGQRGGPCPGAWNL